MDVHTSDGRGVPGRAAGRAAGYGFRGSALGLPRQACRWCWRDAPASVSHCPCDVHAIAEQEAAFYGRVARLWIDSLAHRGRDGVDEAGALLLERQALVCTRAAATMALDLVGREGGSGAPRGNLVRCARCGSPTRGTREGGSVCFSACGGGVAA